MKGNVRLRVECLLPEVLIKRAMAAGVCFCGVRRPDARTLIVDTDAAGARRLLKLCRRFSIPAQIIRRTGASAVVHYLKSRATLGIGAIVCVILCVLFLGRIWRVDIAFTGDAAHLGDEAQFRRLLEELDVRPGISNRIDAALLSELLQARAGNASFVGVRVQGTRLLVEAAPELPAPQVYDVEAPRDLVARQDGIVVSATVRSGELCVKPGDTVRRGQLLIRGEEKDTQETTRPIAALGEVVVRTWVAGEARLPLAVNAVRETGRRRTASRVRAMDYEWPITTCEAFDSQRVETEILPIGGVFVPLEIVRETYYETELVEMRTDEEAVRARVRALAMADAAMRLSLYAPADCAVQRVWADIEPAGDGALRAQAVYEITTDAAVTRDALLQGG